MSANSSRRLLKSTLNNLEMCSAALLFVLLPIFSQCANIRPTFFDENLDWVVDHVVNGTNQILTNRTGGQIALSEFAFKNSSVSLDAFTNDVILKNFDKIQIREVYSFGVYMLESRIAMDVVLGLQNFELYFVEGRMKAFGVDYSGPLSVVCGQNSFLLSAKVNNTDICTMDLTYMPYSKIKLDECRLKLFSSTFSDSFKGSYTNFRLSRDNKGLWNKIAEYLTAEIKKLLIYYGGSICTIVYSLSK